MGSVWGKVERRGALPGWGVKTGQVRGVGPRAAERVARWMGRARGSQPAGVARAVAATRQSIRPCPQCGFFTVGELCEICTDATRVADQLCVVEQATDILPLDRTNAFRGFYHPLGGRISPLAQVGPEALRINELVEPVRGVGCWEGFLALRADGGG